MVLIEIEASF